MEQGVAGEARAADQIAAAVGTPGHGAVGRGLLRIEAQTDGRCAVEGGTEGGGLGIAQQRMDLPHEGGGQGNGRGG